MINATYKKPFFNPGGGGTTLPTYVSGQFLTNDGTNLSWSANGAGDLLANGTVPLTANWAAGAFNISAQTLSTTETLGAETVADFSTWTAASGWTFGTGKWTHSSGTTTLEDDQTGPSYDAGASYKMVVAITHSGTGSLLIGLVNKNLKSVSATGTHTIYFRAIGDLEDALLFTPATGWTGSIDSVSIKKVTGNYITSGSCVLGPDQIIIPHSTYSYPAIAFGAYNGFGISSSPTQLNILAYSTYGLYLYADGYSIFNCALNNATGNEYALGINYETSKAAGNDYGLYIHQTDSVSGGTSYLIFADVADVGTKFTVDNTGVTTALSYVLSGTGTLTSTAGNATFTTALTAASGNEVAFTLNYTTNKVAGNDSGLVINQTDTLSPGTSYLADFQVGGVSKFEVDNNGGLWTSGYNISSSIFGFGATPTPTVFTDGLFVCGNRDTTTGDAIKFYNAAAFRAISGARVFMNISPSYNQASGTAANTDLQIARTSTATGSGAQKFISATDDTVEKFSISDKGFEMRAHPLACTHDTATALFGITVAAGSTAGGVITYTLNVTDDDGSDDQIEVGTVQFCGLQDEANWHTNISEVSTQACESGTLATTWAIDTATADTLKVTLQANSNLTTPVYTLSYTVTFNNAYTVTTY